MTIFEYPCADGTMLPVQFAAPGDEAVPWRLETEHIRNPLPPMAEAMQRLGRPGAHRAYEDVGLGSPPFFARRRPDAAGFCYVIAEDLSEVMLSFTAGLAPLVVEHGGADGIWEKHSLPRVREACERLRTADHTVPLADLAEVNGYSLQKTMIPAFALGIDMRAMAELVEEAFPGEGSLRAYEVTQGEENVTVGADQELWEIGRLVADSPAVTAALEADDVRGAMAAVREAGGDAPLGEAAFFDGLDAFLARYGEQAEVWDIACPTWSELGPGFWAQLRRLAAPDAPEPRRTLAEGAARRAATIADIESRLSDPEKLASFRRKLERLRCYVPVREDRALWQLIGVGALRGAVLRRGERLVSLGLLDDAEDILFLLPDEVDGISGDGSDLRPLVSQRRAEHARWQAVQPPFTIGTPAADKAEAKAADQAADDSATEPPAAGVLQGRAGSRGTVTAPARVVLDLTHADDLQPGEVLVCPTTSPPWTPLFNVAAAVVTNSGDIGSHSAIAAREYGIPCVVGTGTATTTIQSGTLVTVDGGAGTVTVHADWVA